jgi:SAM-dependent methyltransferase
MRSLNRLAVHFGLASREAKWKLYCREFPPRAGERVLDVGVSNLDDLPGENFFLEKYPYPDQLTGVGISDLSELRIRYPKVTFIQADGRDLPFENDSFDIVHSNAVIEHVGPKAEQARFAAELTRVAKSGFLTTPNRWFPIESHTRIPLAHWLRRSEFVRLLKLLGHRDWPVWLLSARQFRNLFPSGLELSLTRQRMAGWPATLIVLFRRS